MERAAAEDNNGYTESDDSETPNVSTQEESELEEDHTPPEAELKSQKGTVYIETINSEFFSNMNDFWDRSKAWLRHTSDGIKNGDAKEIGEDFLQGLTGTTDPLEALDKVVMFFMPFIVPSFGTMGKAVSEGASLVEANGGKIKSDWPKTKTDLVMDLKTKGFEYKGKSPAGYETYKGPGERTVTIKPDGEVITVQRVWKTDGSGKYPPRQDYDGNHLPEQSHTTGYFVE